MALVNTTLAAAKSASDTFLKVSASTGFGVGYKVRIGEESYTVSKGYVAGTTTVPVTLEKDGTVCIDHANGAQVTVGIATDWATQTVPQTTASFPIAARGRDIFEMDGTVLAVPLPKSGNDALVVISGTAHTTLTLAAPTKDLNGCKLGILDLTAAAHVITFATGFGGGALVTATFDASGRCFMELMAYNEVWYAQNFSGTLTSFDIALS